MCIDIGFSYSNHIVGWRQGWKCWHSWHNLHYCWPDKGLYFLISTKYLPVDSPPRQELEKTKSWKLYWNSWDGHLFVDDLRSLPAGNRDLFKNCVCGIKVKASLRVEICRSEAREESWVGTVWIALQIIAVWWHSLYGCMYTVEQSVSQQQFTSQKEVVRSQWQNPATADPESAITVLAKSTIKAILNILIWIILKNL